MSELLDDLDLTEFESLVDSEEKNEELILQQKVAEEMKAFKSKLVEELTLFLKKEITKIKPNTRVIERVIQSPKMEVIKPEPQKVIEKTIVREKQIDVSKFVDISKLEELKKLIDGLKEQIRKEPDVKVVGDMLPNYSGSSGKVLSNDGNQLKWVTAASGSASGSSEVYSVSNVTTRRTLDADDTSLDELSDLVCTLIQDFQAVGLVQ